MSRYEDALGDYNRVLEIDPELANAYANRGSAHRSAEYEKAIADYEKALELDPEIDDAPGFLDQLSAMIRMLKGVSANTWSI